MEYRACVCVCVCVCVYVYGWLDFRCFDIFNYVYIFYLNVWDFTEVMKSNPTLYLFVEEIR